MRDRLKVQAARAYRTLGEPLAHLADLGDREFRFEALRLTIADTPPEAMESFATEVAAWEAVDRD